MQYIYLNNVRGFSKALVPIRSCNFLVGENSTGKSSFLSLLRLLSRTDFFFRSQISLDDSDSPASFSDLVSAWTNDKSFFDIGTLDVTTTPDGSNKYQYSLHRFSEKSGAPILSQHIQRRANDIIHIRFSNRATEYLRAENPHGHEAEAEGISEFMAATAELDAPSNEFKKLPRNLSGFPPLGLALAVVSSLEGGKKPNTKEFQFEMPAGRQLTWIAPIRTKPQRIYDGLTRDYSAEGAHAPFVLKQQLKSTQFVQKLREFGQASGLFEILSTHTFGKGVRNPFEVLVQLNGASFNVENVGYGVSQALPLVVEFLSSKQSKRFAVQQPEVHLHPRAQAALGSLLFFLALEKKHTFIVETHSDFLIDRYRLEMSGAPNAPDSQVLFFERTKEGNTVKEIAIDPKGRFPSDQPPQFRDFFIREEMRLLSL